MELIKSIQNKLHQNFVFFVLEKNFSYEEIRTMNTNKTT